MKPRLIYGMGVCAVFWASVALAGPIGAADNSGAGGVPTLLKLVQNLGQQQLHGQLGSPARGGGEVSVYLQSPAASVPSGGLSMVYVPGNTFRPDMGTLQLAARRNWLQTTPAGQNLGFTSTGYDLGQTLGVSVTELGNYLYVVHVPFNIAIKDRYTDPGPAAGGPLPVVVPAPSSTMLGLLGLVLIGCGIIRVGRVSRIVHA